MAQFDEAAFAAGLQDLKVKFYHGLPERIALILRANANSVSGWHYDAQMMDEVMDELHRLAGAAGSLGFDGLATAARSVELQLKQLPVGEPLPDDWFAPLQPWIESV
ncbi:Hpt domain-containing protein [Chitinibacter bivalviorum]|uniref:Hpt domain-containing protein n=1 Tax=Chitinibacter bivalviorum TaxID=2739434 RepID=A0A7H9BHU6_9NEIS|nr:Hpt domain-containing protein [Chitinibacter bivalviorum]QLG87778.1 Hpt domain-containing protein [Chitinibacter bivalviorum]